MEFLNGEQISGRAADNILSAEDRNSAYSRNRRAHSIWLAGDAVLNSIELLQKQSVFMPDGLSGRFDTVLNDLNMARIEQHMKMRPDMAPHIKVERSIALIGAEGDRTFQELRNTVRNRLLRTPESQKTSTSEPSHLPLGQKDGARA
jgi:hypothetical protein